MSNFVEYKDKVAFHPGYYIKEYVDESGLTQEDFAKRLDTTPKNLSILIRGDQSLSVDMAMKLSRMTGTSAEYWLNIQKTYDALIAEFKSDAELDKEKDIFKNIDYKYFVDNFKLPKLSRRIDEQIKAIREFLNVATISVFARPDMAVNFRSSLKNIVESNIVKANILVQIATNMSLKIDTPKYNKKRFEEAVRFALTQTENHNEFYPLIRAEFKKAGVNFIILPNLPGSKINGATKRVGDNILLMVTDRNLNSDTFWFTLFHEIGHIINNEYGISFEHESGKQEDAADKYAADTLIPPEKYNEFVEQNKFDINSVCEFAKRINRDPGIILGRLQKDEKVGFTDRSMNQLRHKYKVRVAG